MELFKTLTEQEKLEFRKWARNNYKPGSDICGVWHPEVQKECVIINESSIDDEQVYTFNDAIKFVESAHDDNPYAVVLKDWLKTISPKLDINTDLRLNAVIVLSQGINWEEGYTIGYSNGVEYMQLKR